MSNKLIVYKNRTNIISVDLGMDVSGDTITSQIRTEQDPDSALLLTWTVAPVTDGSDGLFTFTADDASTGSVEVDSGHMDIKRVSGGEPFAVFDRPIEVSFQGAVTA